MNAANQFNKTYNRLYQISEKSAHLLYVLEQLLDRMDYRLSKNLRLKQRYSNVHKFYVEITTELKKLKMVHGCSTSLCRPPAKQWIDIQELFSAQSMLEIEHLLQVATYEQLQQYDQLLGTTDIPCNLANVLHLQRNQIHTDLYNYDT
ncbi:hypothetical protein [Maribacter sp. MAR_2009_72]|uniref:hypothetical protein n=1 Tax=Maribacter sp. MAR_2009_72 TaxID=1250050 RepID=UPI00119A3692|nr:hypothetical protein [Maribacter sp. MAR_2009_72]TVZ15451.1 hypothetical protein JM81_1695 [Maribacter sp. MAR_2009_72]